MAAAPGPGSGRARSSPAEPRQSRIEADRHPSLALIARLRGHIDAVLAPLVPPRGSGLALLDSPMYSNVGDSAIWAGTIAYLRHHHATQPSYVGWQSIAALDSTRFRARLGDGAVWLTGGGNFGDLWPAHQAYRIAVIERCRGHDVVQLPQSLYFRDDRLLEATASAISRHGRFTLLVRDEQSNDFARRNFDCNVIMCPDMAFCLGGLPRQAAPRHDLLILARSDHEKRDIAPAICPASGVCLDWIDEPPGLQRSVRRVSLLGGLLGLGPVRAFDRDAQRARYFNALARARVDRGIELLSSASAVATDRLHGHILCTLLGIQHAVADNSYGKLSGFMRAWGTGAAAVHVAESLQEAVGFLAG